MIKSDCMRTNHIVDNICLYEDAVSYEVGSICLVDGHNRLSLV